jgi:hypothetical protein
LREFHDRRRLLQAHKMCDVTSRQETRRTKQ